MTKLHVRAALLIGAATVAMLGFTATAQALPTYTTQCSGCHSGGGVSLTATPVSNNGTTAIYNVNVGGGTAWALFNGATKTTYAASPTGQISVPVGSTYTLFGVNGPTTSNGVSQLAVSPVAPPVPVVVGSISGTVTDASSTVGIAGASVSIGGTSLSATTNSLGAYSIASVPVGARTATIAAAGHVSQTKSFTVTQNVNTAVNAVLVKASVNQMVPVYRFYNMHAGVHFYTASEAEKANIINTLSSVYRFEGPAYYVNAANPSNNQPLYRFYNMVAGVHFYTATESEKTNVMNTMAALYRMEGPSYYVSNTSANAFPVYRFYNLRAGVHFYTASESEKANVINTLGSVYRFEGVGFYVGK